MTRPVGHAGSPGSSDYVDSERYYARYAPKLSLLWWLSKPSYLLFILRELSSVAVLWFVIFLLLLVRAIGRGPAAYNDFLDWAENPVVIVINVIAFAFVLLHVVTWFDLTPKAVVARVGSWRVPGWLILASQYVALAAVSGFVYWLVVEAT